MFKLVIIEISNPNEILFHTHQMDRAGKKCSTKLQDQQRVERACSCDPHSGDEHCTPCVGVTPQLSKLKQNAAKRDRNHVNEMRKLREDVLLFIEI